MPVMALPIFWLMPMGYAMPIYVVIALVSGFFYWLITKAMRQPVRDGFQSLIGTEVEVVSKLGTADHAQYLVRSGGELWGARSGEVLQPGENVRVTALDGIRLMVERGNNESRQIGVKSHERHCH
ncbi:MAG: hypothetical protein A2Z28_00075 [Chloroflexi bacterium RBG_16_51_9]|nr:MAG: hypothetical protein A2Z28_00075 [Chloroflexi bacterium RBG_16_51_9]